MTSKVVEVSVQEVINCDQESWDDLLETLWMADVPAEDRNALLSDISYACTGVDSASGLLRISVTAEVVDMDP